MTVGLTPRIQLGHVVIPNVIHGQAIPDRVTESFFNKYKRNYLKIAKEHSLYDTGVTVSVRHVKAFAIFGNSN